MLFARFGLTFDNARPPGFDKMLVQSDGTFVRLDGAGAVELSGQSRLFICSAARKGEALVRGRAGRRALAAGKGGRDGRAAARCS